MDNNATEIAAIKDKEQMKITTNSKINKTIEATHIINKGAYLNVYSNKGLIVQLTFKEVESISI